MQQHLEVNNEEMKECHEDEEESPHDHAAEVAEAPAS